MASEIRVDKINSLSGVGTVTLSPTGVDISGITTVATFKVGTGVTASSDGDIFATGVTTATTFSGSGASLTDLNASNIASGTVPTARLGSGTASSSTFLRGDSTFAAVTSTTINSNTNNYLITGTGTADTLQGESNLTYDGNNINLAIDDSGEGLRITASGNHYSLLKFDSNVSSAGGSLSNIQGHWNGTEVANIIFAAGDDTSNKDDGIIKFHTTTSGGSSTERLRINSDGKSFFVGSSSGGYSSTTLPNGNTVNINTKVSNDGVSVIRYSGSYAAYALNIGRSKSDNIGTNSIVANGDDLGHITWYGADGTDFNQAAAISVQVDGSPSDGTDMPGRFVFKTSADGSGTPAERLRIASNGDLLYASSDRNYASWYHTPTNSSSNAAVSSDGNLTFGTAVIANTDVYNTSNGRYTAPVDGLYSVRCNGLIDNNASAGGLYLRIRKNDSTYGPNIAYHTRKSEDSTTRYQLLSGSAIVYMSASDYITIYASAGMHASSECNFFVYLIRGTI